MTRRVAANWKWQARVAKRPVKKRWPYKSARRSRARIALNYDKKHPETGIVNDTASRGRPRNTEVKTRVQICIYIFARDLLSCCAADDKSSAGAARPYKRRAPFNDCKKARRVNKPRFFYPRPMYTQNALQQPGRPCFFIRNNSFLRTGFLQGRKFSCQFSSAKPLGRMFCAAHTHIK